MIDKLLEFIKEMLPSKESKDPTAGVTTELAFMILLVDMALVDKDFNQREYDYITQLFMGRLGINEQQVTALVNQAALALGDVGGAHAFAVELEKRLSLQERQEVANALKELVKADDNFDGFEIFLFRKLQDILLTTLH